MEKFYKTSKNDKNTGDFLCSFYMKIRKLRKKAEITFQMIRSESNFGKTIVKGV